MSDSGRSSNNSNSEPPNGYDDGYGPTHKSSKGWIILAIFLVIVLVVVVIIIVIVYRERNEYTVINNQSVILSFVSVDSNGNISPPINGVTVNPGNNSKVNLTSKEWVTGAQIAVMNNQGQINTTATLPNPKSFTTITIPSNGGAITFN